jgi:hypothetical protein
MAACHACCKAGSVAHPPFPAPSILPSSKTHRLAFQRRHLGAAVARHGASQPVLAQRARRLCVTASVSSNHRLAADWQGGLCPKSTRGTRRLHNQLCIRGTEPLGWSRGLHRWAPGRTTPPQIWGRRPKMSCRAQGVQPRCVAPLCRLIAASRRRGGRGTGAGTAWHKAPHRSRRAAAPGGLLPHRDQGGARPQDILSSSTSGPQGSDHHGGVCERVGSSHLEPPRFCRVRARTAAVRAAGCHSGVSCGRFNSRRIRKRGDRAGRASTLVAPRPFGPLSGGNATHNTQKLPIRRNTPRRARWAASDVARGSPGFPGQSVRPQGQPIGQQQPRGGAGHQVRAPPASPARPTRLARAARCARSPISTAFRWREPFGARLRSTVPVPARGSPPADAGGRHVGYAAAARGGGGPAPQALHGHADAAGAAGAFDQCRRALVGG